MLVNSKEILLRAKQEKYALPAPDYIDIDSARVFVKVAEEMNKPLILSFPQVMDSVLPLDEAAAIGVYLAKKATVPVALHLDHGMDMDYITRAVEFGFSSVMIDASSESFEENVRITKEVVALAHPRGITVEAEIGHVGHGQNYYEVESSANVYTTPEEAVRFVAETEVDSLAVSIGTVHGIYKNLEKPTLSFDCLHQLAASVNVPLVLHGGSGTGDDNLHRCATEGISKINIFTDFLTGAMDQIKADACTSYLTLKQSANNGMADVLRHYFKVFDKE